MLFRLIFFIIIHLRRLFRDRIVEIITVVISTSAGDISRAILFWSVKKLHASALKENNNLFFFFYYLRRYNIVGLFAVRVIYYEKTR